MMDWLRKVWKISVSVGVGIRVIVVVGTDDTWGCEALRFIVEGDCTNINAGSEVFGMT